MKIVILGICCKECMTYSRVMHPKYTSGDQDAMLYKNFESICTLIANKFQTPVQTLCREILSQSAHSYHFIIQTLWIFFDEML